MKVTNDTNQREKVVEDIESQIHAVEKALGHFAKLGKENEETVNAIKTKISSSISNLHDLLTTRETQLKRQVDVQNTRQTYQINNHLAALNQILGSLKSSLRCAETLPDPALQSIVIDNIDGFKNLILPGKSGCLNFKMDEDPLKEQIRKLGDVDFPLALGLSREQLNWLNICEYGDDNQPLLHKSLEDYPTDNIKIRVAFPKLSSRTEDWLNMKSQQQMTAEFTNIPLKYSTPSVQDWLRSVRQETGDEPIEVDGFEMIDGRKSSESSESLEILSCTCSIGSGICSQSEMSSPPNKRKMTRLMDKQQHVMEIEDTPVVCQESAASSLLSRICRANEPCSSFMECSCAENCAAVALRHMRKSKRDERNKCVSEMLKPIESMSKQTDGHWLPSSRWLLQNNSSATVASSSDASCWLNKNETPNDESSRDSPKDVVKRLFSDYFQPLNKQIWLRNQSPNSQVDEVTEKMSWLAAKMDGTGGTKIITF